MDFSKLKEKLSLKPTIDYHTLQMKEQIIDDLLEKDKNVFLTGGAGVGKTYITNLICSDPRVTAVRLASTGVAAHLIKGMTVHRFFRFGLSNNLEQLKAWDLKSIKDFALNCNMSEDRARDLIHRKIEYNLRYSNMLVIDEVSMLSKSLIDMIFFRLNSLEIHIPILFVGDFYQLPPVSKNSKPEFAFESSNWNVRLYELTEIKRTSFKDFADIQSKVRKGIKTQEVLDYVDRLSCNPYKEDSLHLFATNAEIDSYNIEKLKALPGNVMRSTFRYNQSLYKEKDVLKFIDEDLLINPNFYFKVGARVLFVTNERDPYDDVMLWFNGEQGTITGIDTDNGVILVKKDSDDKEVMVHRHRFQKVEIKDAKINIVCEVEQFPLRLAYAVSIHKSQGLSLESGHIDCSRFFLPEQFFVALSRFTDPNKLSIANFRSSLIKFNPESDQYYADNPSVFDPNYKLDKYVKDHYNIPDLPESEKENQDSLFGVKSALDNISNDIEDDTPPWEEPQPKMDMTVEEYKKLYKEDHDIPF